MSDITKCPWCNGSLDDFYLDKNNRHRCGNCHFSISKENWDKGAYYPKEIEELEKSVSSSR